MKTRRSQRGRKLGSKTRHTEKGLHPLDNQLRAHWGAKGSTHGGALAHQAWIDRHPTPDTLRELAEAENMTPKQLLAERQAAPLDENVAAEIVAAIDRRDGQFFDDMASTLRRLKEDGTIEADDPQAAALLHYVGRESMKNPARKFTRAELLDEISWGVDENGTTRRPSESQLARLTERFDVPIQRGPTPAK